YYLTNGTTGGAADITFAYGRADDVVLVGDWDGDGTDTLGVRRGNTYYLTNGTTGGAADITFSFGRADDVVLVGDWNGDGKDTLGVRRGNMYYLTNGTTGGAADITFAYGKGGDVVLVGDWNGDGTDTLGVRRSNVYYLTNGTTGGAADITFSYGRADDVVLVGDWDGDGKDTLGVRRTSTYYLTNGTTGGPANITFSYGRGTDVVLVGDWNGDGKDTLGVRRPAVPTSFGEGQFRVGTDIAAGRYKTTIPADSLCYIESAATNGDIIDNVLVYMSVSTTYYWDVDATDGIVTSQDCGTWHTVSPSDAPQLVAQPADGRFRVGIDIAPGTYRTVVPGSESMACYVESSNGFRGSATVLNNANFDGGATVNWTVSPSDVGFESEGCGTWTKVG
ncbi:MAG TPA: hypothetical protein VGC04_06735, partial [Cellulomonas sp.]